MGKYIALQSIQVVDTAGVRRSIEPKSEKHSGLFEHEFDTATEKRLMKLGAIRAPEDLEEHAKQTKVEELHDSRTIEGEATEAAPPKKVAPPKKAKADEAQAADSTDVLE